MGMAASQHQHACHTCMCDMQEWEGLTIRSLLPGMLVNVKVRNVLSDGLLVSFLTFFNGTIDCFHLTQVRPDPNGRPQHLRGIQPS